MALLGDAQDTALDLYCLLKMCFLYMVFMISLLTVNNFIFLIEAKFTSHNINHLNMYASVAFSSQNAIQLSALSSSKVFSSPQRRPRPH